MDMGCERVLPLRIYGKFQNLGINCVLIIKHCDFNFHTYEKSVQCRICTTLMQNCLWMMEIMGLSTLQT